MPSERRGSDGRYNAVIEEGYAVRLRLAYWVAQVCNADAADHRRVARDDWRAGEVVEESNSGAKKNRCDVDVDPSVTKCTVGR